MAYMHFKTKDMETGINRLGDLIHGRSPEDALRIVAANYPGKVVFSTSLGYEDQVITHLICTNRIPVDLFTLDTGRLFAESYAVLESTLERYQCRIKTYYPDTGSVEALVTEKGPNSFYRSVGNRKECCFVRKVEPLKRALAGYSVWVTGIRNDQSESRTRVPALEWDEANQVIKFHPLINWTLEAVKSYVARHNIPYNVLHDRGFLSIGCAPCTRAVAPGESARAGRWWWEQNDQKECGLHARP